MGSSSTLEETMQRNRSGNIWQLWDLDFKTKHKLITGFSTVGNATCQRAQFNEELFWWLSVWVTLFTLMAVLGPSENSFLSGRHVWSVLTKFSGDTGFSQSLRIWLSLGLLQMAGGKVPHCGRLQGQWWMSAASQGALPAASVWKSWLSRRDGRHSSGRNSFSINPAHR